MTPPRLRIALRAVAALALLAGSLLSLTGTAAAQGGSRVDVVEVVGVLDRPLAGFLERTLAAAQDGGAAALVRLDSVGALGGDVDAVVEAIRASAVPVVVYVGTPGARAAGAAVAIAEASHLLALAPASVFGASIPWDLGAPGPDDVGDRLADLAQETGRDPGFARDTAAGRVVIAVPDGEGGAPVAESTDFPPGADTSTATTLDAAGLQAAGIAELVAPTLQDVLAQLDGREVELADGPRTLEVDPATASVRFVNLGLWARVLHTAANPTLVYLLLLSGALALLFEVFQPGFGVAGVAGLGLLALGGYGLTAVPVRPLVFLAAVLGMLLLAADLALARLAALTIVGTALLGAGSWWMWAQPVLRPPLWLVIAGTLLTVVFFVAVMTTVLRAQGNAAHQGAASVTGQVGVVRSMLNPEGHVFVGGQLWRARAPDAAGRVKTGTRVRVVGLNDQLTLEVELEEDDRPQEAAAQQGV